MLRVRKTLKKQKKKFLCEESEKSTQYCAKLWNLNYVILLLSRLNTLSTLFLCFRNKYESSS